MLQPVNLGRAMTRPLLEVRGLSKSFPVGQSLLASGRSVLSAVDDVSFSIAVGETLAVVGETGSGKTTLARMIVRLERPSGGHVVFDGVDVLRATGDASRALRRRMQLIFQNPYAALDPRMRVRDAVAEGFASTSIRGQERLDRVAELMDSVQLPTTIMGNFPHQLSGGQRQRVVIARALAANADLLVADEPVSALDASIQSQIINLLRDLKTKRNLALLLITHDLEIAQTLADRIAVMHQGRMVEVGPVDEVFQLPAHPYTQALVSAIPTYGEARGARIVLTGDPTSPIDPPAACRFVSRCFRAIERCRVEDPRLSSIDDGGRSVACFNWELLDWRTKS